MYAFWVTQLPTNVSTFCGQRDQGPQGVFVYLDDILLVSDSEENYLIQLKELFDRFRKYGLVINLEKSLFGQNSLEFLEHHISPEGITPLQSKVEAIIYFTTPKTQKAFLAW